MHNWIEQHRKEKEEEMKKIIGLVPKKIDVTKNTISMVFTDGSIAIWYHAQDCCESVFIDDIVGDFEDLIGHPLLVAEERVSYDDSYTWTFYTFRSIGGSVDVKWYGTSNGYYSESVDFQYKVK